MTQIGEPRIIPGILGCAMDLIIWARQMGLRVEEAGDRLWFYSGGVGWAAHARPAKGEWLGLSATGETRRGSRAVVLGWCVDTALSARC